MSDLMLIENDVNFAFVQVSVEKLSDLGNILLCHRTKS